MLFAAKVVEPNANGVLLFRLAMIAAVFIIVSMSVESLNFLAPFFLAAALLMLIISAIFSKSDLSSYKLEKNLIIFDDEMQISGFVFPVKELSKIHFVYRTYCNLDEYTPKRNKLEKNDLGLNNELSFVYKKQQFNYDFYIQSYNHYLNFVNMLEQLYLYQVSFTEENYYGKTFMMRNVDDVAYEQLKRKYQPV